MKILAIETSCDETAAAVVENGRVIVSSVVASQIERHRKFGGVVPEIASREHAENIVEVTKKALMEAHCAEIQTLDAIAVTHTPGLIGALLVGVNFAKGVSLATGIPLISVHHLRSHVASNYLSHPTLVPPFLCLIVSGGHSHIVEVKDYTTMRVIGKTLDDAAGETFDKAARAMGIPYPGGVELDRHAEHGNPNRFSFPHPSIQGRPYDYSFSGLKTAMLNRIHQAEQKNESLNIDDLCASFRKTVVECLLKRFLRAAEDFGYDKLVLAGGVSANTLLRTEFAKMCKEHGWKGYVPDLSLTGDNAAMVGSQGFYEWTAGERAGMDLNACANSSIE